MINLYEHRGKLVELTQEDLNGLLYLAGLPEDKRRRFLDLTEDAIRLGISAECLKALFETVHIYSNDLNIYSRLDEILDSYFCV